MLGELLQAAAYTQVDLTDQENAKKLSLRVGNVSFILWEEGNFGSGALLPYMQGGMTINLASYLEIAMRTDRV